MAYSVRGTWLEYGSVGQNGGIFGYYNYQDLTPYNLGILIPEISQIDFVSSLIKMFNLVIINDNETYSLMTYSEWRSRGVTWDISEFVDVGDYQINRESLINVFDFKFNDNDSFLMSEFRKRFNRDYGNLKYTVSDKDIYTNDSNDINISFDNAIFERIVDQENGNKTRVQYGSLEESQKLIHYGVLIDLQEYKIDIGGDPSFPFIMDNILIPSHSQSLMLNRNSTVFGEEIDEFTNEVIKETLFNRHYADDLKKMYNKNTRKVNITAIVSTNILLNIGNEDKILLNGSVFEIDKMTINLSTNQIDFELSFYDAKL